jgi:hypothetical protein
MVTVGPDAKKNDLCTATSRKPNRTIQVRALPPGGHRYEYGFKQTSNPSRHAMIYEIELYPNNAVPEPNVLMIAGGVA